MIMTTVFYHNTNNNHTHKESERLNASEQQSVQKAL